MSDNVRICRVEAELLFSNDGGASFDPAPAGVGLPATFGPGGTCIAPGEGTTSVLYTVPRNPIFPALHKSYTAWLGDHWKQLPRLPDRNRRNFAAHSAILDGILSRDPDVAEHALRSHLADAWNQVRATFENV